MKFNIYPDPIELQNAPLTYSLCNLTALYSEKYIECQGLLLLVSVRQSNAKCEGNDKKKLSSNWLLDKTFLPIQILLPKYEWNVGWFFTMLIFTSNRHDLMTSSQENPVMLHPVFHNAYPRMSIYKHFIPLWLLRFLKIFLLVM